MSAGLIGCPGCGVIQELPFQSEPAELACWRCGDVLARSYGRSIDAALACSVTTLLFLLPANFLPLMTIHAIGISDSTHLAAGLLTSWRQDWPVVTVVLGLLGIVLPFVRFGLLSVTLTAIRFRVRGAWIGPAFRYCEKLDRWAMLDVLAIGFGVGYGRVAAKIPVTINTGGWCFLAAALLTLLTRACLDRRAVWQAVGTPSHTTDADAIACTSCDLVVPGEMEGQRCPRCAARLRRRRLDASIRCTALVVASWVLIPAAYWLPMSTFWGENSPHPHSIIIGLELLINNGFWVIAIVIFSASVGIPFGKLIGLTWFLVSTHQRSSRALRRKTKLYRVIDAAGRWSNLDPFTVMIFSPMVQFGQLAHIDVKDGSLAFLSMVVLSMLAAEVFDPRLIWDAAEEGVGTPGVAKRLSSA